jgi:hypothetical protein
MKSRIAFLAAGIVAAGAVQAQDAAGDRVRQAMFDAANAIAESVAGAPGPVESMIGVSKSEAMRFALDDEQRDNWQFWPTARVGLAIEFMNAEERQLTHDLLLSALSSNGYLKVVHIMQLEQILDMLDSGGLPRSVDHYRLVLFGTPSMSESWAWRFEGHHVSLSVAVSPDGVSVTPSFLGSNPAEVVAGPLTGFRVHGVAENLARELVQSLSPADRTRAVVSDRAPGEIFTGNIRKPRSEWNDWVESLNPEGIPVVALNEVQQLWVDRILDEVVGNYRSELAEPARADIAAESLSFVWMGATERGEPHYFRLQGDDFVFEYDNVQNGGNHVHSVWRSKSMDFGDNMLEQHYRTSHAR